MNDKFIITPKTDSSVTITIRLEYETNQQLEDIALKSGRSRNELINKALKFALSRMEFSEKE